MDLRNIDNSTIDVKPSFGSSASFTANNSELVFGDNYSQISPKGINSLKVNMNLKFNDLIDQEALNLISFFQKQFYYKTQDYNELGFFNNKRIEAFRYSPFFPYKENFFTCTRYNHDKVHYDVNTISANLESVAASSLQNVDHVLATYQAEVQGESNQDNITVKITNTSNSETITFRSQNFLYDPTSYKTYKILSSNTINIDPGGSQNILIENTMRNFVDYSGYTHNVTNRHSMFIRDPNECSFFPYQPAHYDRSFPVKMFDFRANQQTNLAHTPKFKKTNVSDAYAKYNLYGFNPNLFNMQLNFTGRTNHEAKRILLFLESHLGYKKFGFHIQKDYTANNSSNTNTTPHRNNISLYYCPEWSHTYTFFNSHDITATFIECPSF